VTVCNVPAYAENTVAEHTFGLILSLSRRIFRAYERTRKGDFRLQGLRGADLHGKTLGVIGAGAIGLHVIRIGRALGMRCLAHDIRQDPLIADVLGFEYVPLDLLLRDSDVVSLHVPLVPATQHMMDAEALAKMKPGALLINTARGQLVETSAMLNALDSGQLGGVGLDVFEGEVLVGEERNLLHSEASRDDLRKVVETQALLRREDVIVTPHIGFYSQEAVERITQTTAKNVHCFFRGEPQNVVT
jgi:D-lactate dehydrogenase